MRVARQMRSSRVMLPATIAGCRPAATAGDRDRWEIVKQTPYDNLLAAQGYEAVDAFERSACFVTKREHVSVLDVASEAAPERVFTISESRSDAAEIAPMHRSRRFFVSRETTLFLLEPNGTVVAEFDIEEISSDRPRAQKPPPYEDLPESINWRMETSEDDASVFFTWLTEDHDRLWVGRLEIATGAVDWCPVDFGFGTAFDTESGRVFQPWAYEERGIYVSTFESVAVEYWPSEGVFHQLSMSADRRHLLASDATLRGNSPPLVIVDVATGESRQLDLIGMDATWARDGRIWFHNTDSGLCVADGPDAPSRQIFGCETIASENAGSWFMPPVISFDGSWVAWIYQERDGRQRQLLLDVESQTYRVLESCNHTCAWV